MNAVEIEQAVSELAEQVFDPAEFPYAFLQAFGNKETTLRKLRTGDTNKSDRGGVLQRNNIHIAIATRGDVSATLAALRASPATAKHKVKFILATDGEWLEAEDLGGGTPLACEFVRLPDYFGFFLPLAGISTVREIVENAFDIRATSKLNRLYIELLKENPDWGTDERRPDMNHFMARLIFSFFAEDTGIFADDGLFTETVSQMSARDSSNTHEVIGTIFRAMNTRHEIREAARIPRWADRFPYVNGGLSSGAIDVPRFSRTARAYLLQVGSLDWKQINPDIFGSMIQAVADDEERGALGMHYTSVPNILKVLNPLFLDDLRANLDEAGDNPRKLLNLRNRIKRIRVFDPACGSGNFLVIAYKELRTIEHEINRRRKEGGRRSEIPLTNFRGIELRDFAAEIARLALIIAEFQCDVLFRGQQEALNDFLPLDAENWITCGNALRLDWLAICPPTGTSVKLVGDDLFSTPLDQSEIDFENAGGETYICGNPPYLGGKKQNPEQKAEMRTVAAGRYNPSNLDYVCAFITKAVEVLPSCRGVAFVATSSINQGIHVPGFWPFVLGMDARIIFCYEPFKWANSARANAGVYCTILGLAERSASGVPRIYSESGMRVVRNINPYLLGAEDRIVKGRQEPLSALSKINTGNQAADGGNLFLSGSERNDLLARFPHADRLLRRVVGTSELFDGGVRWCLWIDDDQLEMAEAMASVKGRIDAVRQFRRTGGDVARDLVETPHQFRYRNMTTTWGMIVPQVSSDRREYIPPDWFDRFTVVTHKAHAVFQPTFVDLAIFASRLHFVWAATVSGRLGNGISYSSNIGWNTFPVPPLTEQNKADLTRTAGEILLAREAHYPATIAELYDPKKMPANLHGAHERNDEVLERIYIGRTFRNDTERLEKLFDMYTKMTANEQRPIGGRSRRKTR